MQNIKRSYQSLRQSLDAQTTHYQGKHFNRILFFFFIFSFLKICNSFGLLIAYKKALNEIIHIFTFPVF